MNVQNLEELTFLEKIEFESRSLILPEKKLSNKQNERGNKKITNSVTC